MLNTLVNSTGEGLCNQTSAYYKQSCIDEIFECIGTVACQTDMNTEALEQIHDNLQTTNVSATNVSADSVCTNSVCANAISTVGIEANNVQSQCLNVAGKATVGSLESNGTVKAESVETQSLSTENITGLQSLTVDGCVWADAVDTDALKVNGKAVAECIEADEISTESLKSDTISTSTIGADTVVSDCFMGTNANIQKACIGSLSTSCFSSDEIATSKINSTSLSVPKVETSGGITGKGTIDTTSPVWKEIKIPLFTGTVQFYTDEWKVTINGGREFIWEDPSLDHLKFLSNDGEVVTVAVDWDGEVFYTYNVAKEEPVLSFADNTGHTPDDDHTYIMQDSGIPRGTVYIYQDKEFTNQGLTILGKVKASNLEITCGESLDCLSVGNLCVGNSIISDSPIEVNICARNFCVSSPCTYIDNCLYADHLEAKCVCTHNLCFDDIQMVDGIGVVSPKKVVAYKDGLLCSSCKVCADDDTVYSPKVCITGSPLSEGKSGFYGNLHGKADDSCCFDGRTFAKACNEILSGKACKAELADFAQRTCIWCRWGEDDPGCYGYVPFADYVDKCLFFGTGDPNMANPFIVYNSYGLVCMELRGCLCLKDRPLIVDDAIDSDYMHTGYLRVKQNALITQLCSCNDYTEQLCVRDCAKFRGPVYFYDNIYQCGKAYCTHAQNIYTCSDTITMREGAGFAGEAQIKVLKYDGTNNGIIQLGTDGTLRIGDETNCQPVLTRSEEADICDGHVLVWDATNRCAKDGGDAIVTCDFVHCVGKECKNAACDYACIVGTQCKTAACNYATSVGTQCKAAACKFAVSCGHDIGTSCKTAACKFAVSCGHEIGTSCKNASCSFAVACGHEIGTACKNASTATKANCYGNNYNCVQYANCSTKIYTEPYTVASKRFIYFGDPAQPKNIGCNPNLWFCPTCNIMVMGDKCGSALCLVGNGSCCVGGVCSKLNPKIVFSSTDSQCGCLQYTQYDGVHPGAGLCWITNQPNTWFQTDCVYANKYLDKDGNDVGTICKNASCAFAVSCGHAIGTACKDASAVTKANCFGKSYNCVACSDLTRKTILGAYTAPQKRFVYFGNPADATPTGCNPNFWFCPTCNVLAMTGGEDAGSTLCLVGKGSCCMSGVGSKENPKIVFSDIGGHCGCLQLSRYTCTHPGYGLCWMANYTLGSWIQTDCFYAKCYLDSNGNCLAGYTATVPSPNGTTRYVLLDLGKDDTMVDFQIYNSHGTIVKSTNESAPTGTIYQSNSYGINGYFPVEARGSCFWLKITGYRALNLWGSYPIKVLSNTTTNPGCTWDSPTILPTCDYVSTVGGQCKSAACTYANTVAFCNINTCKGLGVMGVARGIDAQCWTKAGYWAYMTTKDGPNCCWNHVIKTDWSAGVDVWNSGISIPTYNAPQNGIHYKVRCCGGTTGWTLIPDITCVQNLGLSCRDIAEACACAFAATCAQSVVPETSTFAKCYGNSTNCVAYANQVRVGVASGNAFYKMPFTGSTGTTTSNQSLYIDNANAYPTYNPSTNVFCGYTVCVAQTLAVRNANGGFRLGNYCIYIA